MNKTKRRNRKMRKTKKTGGAAMVTPRFKFNDLVQIEDHPNESFNFKICQVDSIKHESGLILYKVSCPSKPWPGKYQGEDTVIHDIEEEFLNKHDRLEWKARWIKPTVKNLLENPTQEMLDGLAKLEKNMSAFILPQKHFHPFPLLKDQPLHQPV